MSEELNAIRERWDFSEREPTTPAGHDLKALLEIVTRIEGERDAALRNLAACKPWLKNRLPFNVAKSVDDACAVIEAARKMGDE